MSDAESHDVQVHDELTAYLDGELDAAAVRQVEDRLAHDADYRAELGRLERAWSLLDRLPRATVSDEFTKSTIEMVAVVASEDAAVAQQPPKRANWQRMASVAGAVAAGVAGFFIGHALWPDPNRKLIEDLPVVQDFDRYYQVDNIEFLQMLDKHHLFADGDNDHAG